MIKLVTRKLCCKFIYSPGWSLLFLKIKMKRYRAVMDRKETSGVMTTKFTVQFSTNKMPSTKLLPNTRARPPQPQQRRIPPKETKATTQGKLAQSCGSCHSTEKASGLCLLGAQKQYCPFPLGTLQKDYGWKTPLLELSWALRCTSRKYDKAITMKKQLWETYNVTEKKGAKTYKSEEKQGD